MSMNSNSSETQVHPNLKAFTQMVRQMRGVLYYARQYAAPSFGVFLTVASGIIGINDHLIELTSINGGSMAPTLSPNYSTTQERDWILWRKYRPTHDLKRGDVVLFAAPHKPEGIAVKRVVALGGDTVLLDPRRRPQNAKDGRRNPEARSWDMWSGRVVVPTGHVWVEGDYWRSTHDSNAYGPISKSLIKGKAMVLVWPWQQLGTTPWEWNPNRTKVIEGEEILPKRNESPVYWQPVE